MMSKLAALFKGKESKKEEMSEAKAVKSGKLSPAGYAAGEKKEGEKESKAALVKRGQSIKNGKLSPAAYAKMEAKEPKPKAKGKK